MKKITFTLILIWAGLLPAQYVTTILQSPNTKITDAIIFDSQGNLYGSDYSGTNIYKREPNGNVSVFVTGLNTPNGLAFDSQQNLFACDHQGNAIYKIDPNGTITDTFQTSHPSGIIKMMGSDTMIFTQYDNNKILKLAPDGNISSFHSSGILSGPVGLAYDQSGQLYGANFNNRKVYKIHADSLEYWATVPGPGSGSQALGFIAFAKNSLYATSFDAHQIYRVELSQADSVELFAGSSIGITDGHVSIAKFNRPNGICASLSGDTIYVSDYGNGRLRMITDTPLKLETGDTGIQLETWPNPAQNLLYLRLPKRLTNAKIKVFDLQGKLCLEADESGVQTAQLKIESLRKGYYTIVLADEGHQYLANFVKE